MTAACLYYLNLPYRLHQLEAALPESLTAAERARIQKRLALVRSQCAVLSRALLDAD